jgi:hypothetical protein
MVNASVVGVQGSNISDANSCACSLKHFIGYPDPVYAAIQVHLVICYNELTHTSDLYEMYSALAKTALLHGYVMRGTQSHTTACARLICLANSDASPDRSTPVAPILFAVVPCCCTSRRHNGDGQLWQYQWNSGAQLARVAH